MSEILEAPRNDAFVSNINSNVPRFDNLRGLQGGAPKYLAGQTYPPAALTGNTKVFSNLSYGNNIKCNNFGSTAQFVNNNWNGGQTTFTGAGTFNGP